MKATLERSHRPATAIVALVAIATLSACGSKAANLPPEPAVVNVTMTEYRFERPSVIPAGRVIFRVHNAGKIQHVLQLAPLPEDFPDVAMQASGKLPPRHTEELGGIPALLPGETDQFAVDLVPGRYTLLDLMLDRDGQTHAQKGMTSEFRVAGRVPETSTVASSEPTSSVPGQ